jgi:hypothetical protein
MVSTTHVVRRKNDGKYFKVVTHPILITELNSANPNDLKGDPTTMQTDIDVLLLNGYELVNGVNRSSSNRSISNYSSSNTSHRSSNTSHRSRGTGSTKSMSTMSSMSSRSSRSSKGGKTSRNLKYKNKTKKGKM